MTQLEAAEMAEVTDRTVRNCLARFQQHARAQLGVEYSPSLLEGGFMNSCLSELALDDHEIHGRFDAASEAHLQSCVACQARRSARDGRRPLAEFRVELGGAHLDANLGAAPDGAASRSLRGAVRRTLGAAVASLVGLIVLRREQTGPDRLIGRDSTPKGIALAEIVCRRGDWTFALRSGDEVAAGDALRFRPLPSWPAARYIQVGSVDGTGAYAPFYPPSGEGISVVLPAPGSPLGGSIRLDAAPGPERLFIVLSATPLGVRDVRQAAEAHAASSERIDRIAGAPVSSSWTVLPKREGRARRALRMLSIAIILAAQLGAAPGAPPAVERVAIVASAGLAEGQTPLRYAERDADRMAAVLRDLGGFDRVEQLRDPRPQALRAALDRVEREAAGNPIYRWSSTIRGTRTSVGCCSAPSASRSTSCARGWRDCMPPCGSR